MKLKEKFVTVLVYSFGLVFRNFQFHRLCTIMEWCVRSKNMILFSRSGNCSDQALRFILKEFHDLPFVFHCALVPSVQLTVTVSAEMPKPLMIQTKSCSVLGCALKHLLIFTTKQLAVCWLLVQCVPSQKPGLCVEPGVHQTSIVLLCRLWLPLAGHACLIHWQLSC